VLAVLIFLRAARLGFFWILAVGAVVTFGAAQIAPCKIGGQTNDVLQQLIDLAALTTQTTMIG